MQDNVTALSATHKTFRFITNCTMFITLCAFGELSALPILEQVASGEVNVQAGTGSSNLQVNQVSDKAILNWDSFNIAPSEAVHFAQPNNGVCLNRIDALNGMSHIDGALSATGRILLINQAGILLGENSNVNVGSIIASAADISDKNFLANKFIFDAKDAAGAIINRGSINVSDGGLVTLLGAGVANDGIINAFISNITMASGNKFTLDFNGDQLINFTIDKPATKAPVDENGKVLKVGVDVTGHIINDSGLVFITGKATKDVFDKLINMDGELRAQTVEQREGIISLLGGEDGAISVAGTIDASGREENAQGGMIAVVGGKINVTEEAVIDVSGNAGGGMIYMGDSSNASPVVNSVMISPNARLNADAIESGNGGEILIWSKNDTKFSGNATARGGKESGDGGLVEISSHGDLFYDEKNAFVDTTAAQGATGTLLIDPKFLIVQTTGGNPYLNNLNNLYTNNPSGTTILTPTSIINSAQLNNIKLQANSDVIVNEALTFASNGRSLTINAGRSVMLNANMTTNNGAVTVTANDNTAQAANRATDASTNPSGDTQTVMGNIVMGASSTINAGTAAINISVGATTTSPYTPGSITTNNLSGGVITLSTPDSLIGTGNITNSSSLNITVGNTSNINGVISGAGAFIKNGTGNLTLNNINTYTGTTTINAGILKAGVANVIANSTSVTLANTASAGFDLNDFNQTIGTLFGAGATGGNITLGTANLTVTQAANNNFAGIISGSGNLIKEGPNTLTLVGLNTYTGSTLINHGVLRTNTNNTLPSTTNVVIADEATARLNLANTNQAIASLSGGGTSGGSITLGSGTLSVAQAINGTYSGDISGTGGVTINGSAVLTLGGVNSYTGATTITSGTLRAGNNNIIANSSPMTMGSSAIFDLNNFNQTVGTLSGSGQIILGSGTLSINQAALNTYAGVISGLGNVTKNGSATLILNGANSYTGTTTINAGKIQAGAANTLVSAVNLSDVSGVTFDLDGYNQAISDLSGGGISGGNVNLGAATLSIAQANNQNFAGIISGSGGVTLNGSAVLTLSGANTYTGPTNITSGTLRAGAANVITNSSPIVLGNNASAILDLNNFNQAIGNLVGGGVSGGNINLGSATLNVNQVNNNTYAGIISGTGNVIKSGAARLTLSGINTYTGTTAINAGALQAGSANVIANSSAVILANVSGAKFDLNNFNQSIKTLSGAGGTGGNVALGSANLTINQATADTYAGVISGTGNLIFNGTNSLTLTGNNTYTGTTNITAGSLKTGAAFVIPDNSAVTLSDVSGASLDLNSYDQVIGTLTGGGASGGNINLGNAVLTVNQTAASNFAGVIGGTGHIVLSNSSTNTLTLSGVNTYSGTTSINGGVLSVSADANLGAAPGIATPNNLKLNGGSLNVANTLVLNANRGINLGVSGGTIQTNPSVTVTYNGVISGSGALYKSGTGKIILGGVSTYTGATNILNGSIQTAIPNAIANTSAVTLANTANAQFNLDGFSQTVGTLAGGGALGGNIALGSGTLTVTQGINNNFAGVISGTGGLTKEGTARLTLTRANTYSGATTINSGNLQAGVVNVLDPNSNVVLANAATAKFDLNDLSQSIGSLSGGGATGGNVTLGSATLTVNQNTNTNYAGIISGTGNVVKNGTANLSLSGLNTYVGSTTVNSGLIQAGANNVITESNVVTLANVSGAGFDLNNFNQTINNLTGGGASGGNVALGTATLTLNQTAPNTYAGSISGSGGVTLSGPALLIISGNNTYTGPTTINSGTLRAGAANVLAPNSALILANSSGALFDLNSFAQTVGSVSGGGGTGGNITLGSADLTINQGVNANFAGVISGTGGVVKQGSATLNVSGDNSYTGTTQINAGVIQAGAINSFAPTSNVSLNDAAGVALDLNDFNQTIASLNGGGTNGGNINLGSGVLLVTQTTPGTYAGVINGTGNVVLTLGSTDALTLSGANTYTGSTSVRAGTLRVSADNNLGTAPVTPTINQLNLNGGTLEAVDTFNIDANRGVTLGASNGTISVNATKTLTYDGIVTGSGSLTKADNGKLELGGANTYTGATIVTGGSLQTNVTDAIASSSGVNLSNVANASFDLNDFNQVIGNLAGGGNIGGNINLGTATLTVQQGAVSTYSGVISGTGGLTKSGSATLVLRGANTYTGPTTINAGVLRAGAENVLDSQSHLVLANATGAAFDLNNFNQSVGDLNGGGMLGGNVLLGSATLTVNQNLTDTYTGIISGSGGITLDGNGTLILQGANTYSGVTSVAAGTLRAGANNVLSSTSPLTLADDPTALFDLNDFDQSIGSLSGGGVTGGNVTLGQATLTVNQSTNTDYAGVISDFTGGNLVLNGSATLTLSGANTYSGNTTISSGVLQAGAEDVIANSNSLTLANASGAEFALNDFNQTIGSLVGGGGAGGNVSLGAATLTINQNDEAEYSGVISGDGSVHKAGAAPLLMGNVNTYTGSTTIASGTLEAGAVNTITTSSPVYIDGGALFDLNGYNQRINTMIGVSDMGVNVVLHAATLDVANGTNLVIQE